MAYKIPKGKYNKAPLICDNKTWNKIREIQFQNGDKRVFITLEYLIKLGIETHMKNGKAPIL